MQNRPDTNLSSQRVLALQIIIVYHSLKALPLPALPRNQRMCSVSSPVVIHHPPTAGLLGTAGRRRQVSGRTLGLCLTTGRGQGLVGRLEPAMLPMARLCGGSRPGWGIFINAPPGKFRHGEPGIPCRWIGGACGASWTTRLLHVHDHRLMTVGWRNMASNYTMRSWTIFSSLKC